MKSNFVKNVRIAILLSTTAAMMVSFQNCAQPGASNLNEDASESSAIHTYKSDASAS